MRVPASPAVAVGTAGGLAETSAPAVLGAVMVVPPAVEACPVELVASVGSRTRVASVAAGAGRSAVEAGSVVAEDPVVETGPAVLAAVLAGADPAGTIVVPETDHYADYGSVPFSLRCFVS